jgi:carbonic anhydrase
MSSHSFCRTVLFASILGLVGLPAVTAAHEAHPPHWDYEGKQGPKEWGNLDSSYAGCSMGHTQSPIDIKDARKADLPTLNFDYHAVPLNDR